jgi:hypothetical protein
MREEAAAGGGGMERDIHTHDLRGRSGDQGDGKNGDRRIPRAPRCAGIVKCATNSGSTFLFFPSSPLHLSSQMEGGGRVGGEAGGRIVEIAEEDRPCFLFDCGWGFFVARALTKGTRGAPEVASCIR